MQSEKERIRQNRLKLKNCIKSICTVQTPDSGQTVWKGHEEPKQKGQVRRRRKTSENFQSFESMSTLKDIAITENFWELFLLSDKVGEGAQSNVYKCIELKSGIQYAVKIAKKKDPELFENMRQCYELLRQLNHPNIVRGQYLFLNQKKLTCHLVQQFIQYPNLRKYMDDTFHQCKIKNQHYALEETITAQILKVLLNCASYMRQMKVCHRDLKPDNILYDPATQNIKIIDFQIAKMQRYKHEQLALLSQTGTLHYRAPETFKGGQYGIQIDLWAIGIIAFEMLTGRVPFKSSFAKTTSRMIQEENINFQGCHLSSEAKSMISKMLQKNPEKRITPDECLSCPFFLKNLSPNRLICRKNSIRRVQSFENIGSENQNDSDGDKPYTPSRYYDADMTFSYADTISQDLGIRFCGE